MLFTLNQVFMGALLGSLLCPVGHFVLAQVLSVLDHENSFGRDYPGPSAGWGRLCSVESPRRPVSMTAHGIFRNSLYGFSVYT